MKKTAWILFWVLAGGVLALLAAQSLLNRRLTPEVRKALPSISRRIGLELEVGNASVNLFTGTFSASSLALLQPRKDPPVLAVDHLSARIGWRGLLDRIIHIRNASAREAVVTVVRSREGAFNLARQPAPAEPDTTSPPPGMPEPAAPVTQDVAGPRETLPRIHLEQAGLSMRLDYIDHHQGGETPLHLALEVTLAADGIFTYGDLPPSDWGSLTLRAHAPARPGTFLTDMRARVAPVDDPARASFTAEGSMLEVRLSDFADLCEQIGLSSDSVDLHAELNVLDGHFMDGSALRATLRDARTTGSLKRQYRDLTLPPTLTLVFPIGGTLADPSFNIPRAVTRSILRLLADNPDYLLDQITVDGKSLRERLTRARGTADGETPPAKDKTGDPINRATRKLRKLF